MDKKNNLRALVAEMEDAVREDVRKELEEKYKEEINRLNSLIAVLEKPSCQDTSDPESLFNYMLENIVELRQTQDTMDLDYISLHRTLVKSKIPLHQETTLTITMSDDRDKYVQVLSAIVRMQQARQWPP